MIGQIRALGINSNILYFASMVSILMSIVLWFSRLQATDRASAERFGIFVGLWAPTFLALGNAVEEEELAER